MLKLLTVLIIFIGMLGNSISMPQLQQVLAVVHLADHTHEHLERQGNGDVVTVNHSHPDKNAQVFDSDGMTHDEPHQHTLYTNFFPIYLYSSSHHSSTVQPPSFGSILSIFHFEEFSLRPAYATSVLRPPIV